jgi:putative hemolysin
MEKKKTQKKFKISTTLLSKAINSNYFIWKPFKSKTPIYINNQKYLIKTAENNKELNEVFSLRYKVFHKEILKQNNVFKIDIDKFDKYCDHLLIIDKNINKVIGTYRINIYSKKFYSAKEFHIKKLLDQDGAKAELGRACILEEYRKGIILALLWKGIRCYIEINNIRFLFGCSSIFSEEKKEAINYFSYFKDNDFLHPTILIKPKKKYSIKKFDSNLQYKNSTLEKISSKSIPDLLKAYLKFGAKICSLPAYDREFKCIDFLTVIDYNNVNKECLNKISRL